MLRAGVTEEELVAHLHAIETEQMGLDGVRPHHALLKLPLERGG